MKPMRIPRGQIYQQDMFLLDKHIGQETRCGWQLLRSSMGWACCSIIRMQEHLGAQTLREGPTSGNTRIFNGVSSYEFISLLAFYSRKPGLEELRVQTCLQICTSQSPSKIHKETQTQYMSILCLNSSKKSSSRIKLILKSITHRESIYTAS